MVYIKNKELLNELIISKQHDQLSKNAEKMFIKIVVRLGHKFKYKNEDDRLDCQQTAYLDLFGNWRNFDPTKSNNAFAYITEIAKRGYARAWKQLYRQKGNEGKNDLRIPHFSIQAINEGKGMYNL